MTAREAREAGEAAAVKVLGHTSAWRATDVGLCHGDALAAGISTSTRLVGDLARSLVGDGDRDRRSSCTPELDRVRARLGES